MNAKITRMNPEQLHATPGYHHITVVEAGRTAYLAGQCPLDGDGSLVGDGDLGRQIDQVAANALTALAAVGAKPEDVLRTVIYVCSEETEVLWTAWRRLTDSPSLRPSALPAPSWASHSWPSPDSSSRSISPWHCPTEPARVNRSAEPARCAGPMNHPASRPAAACGVRGRGRDASGTDPE